MSSEEPRATLRSRSGCWTCRLRTKKKCDEAKPTCERCAMLGVRCFGYGARPTPEQLGDHRRARIAKLGDAAKTADGRFKVWRLKGTSTVQEAGQRAPHSHSPAAMVGPVVVRTGGQFGKIRPRPGGWQQSQQQPRGVGRAGDDRGPGLVALDRLNSCASNFFHPQLLRYYLDKVFWLDSRFYECPGPYKGNEWLLPYLTDAKETHLAAALMGLTYHNLIADPSRVSNIHMTQSLGTLHMLVMQNLRDDIERSRHVTDKAGKIKLSVKMAKCVAILLVFEVWRTVEGDWLTHFSGLGEVIRWMDKEIPDALRVSLMVKVRPDGADGPDNDLSKLAETEEEAFTYLTLKWVINSYSWNDVVALVWIGADYSPSRATAVYRPFVEGGYLQIDKMIGCEDWVLSRLLEISRMEEDRQRRREQPGIGRGRGGNEDDDDLTAKAADLDHQLNARLRYHTTRRNRLSSDRERDVAYISEMWIHTALVYLHVVTAGPRSSHPRLRHYVASGLHAYVRLPRHDDIHTALPFAVLASMACGEEEQAEFWRVATSPRSLGEINPGQRKTLAIVKECWRLRELMESSSPDGGVFWRDGAKSLGQVVFPV